MWCWTMTDPGASLRSVKCSLTDEVKQVYKDLKLDQVYTEYEKKALVDLADIIESIDETEGLRKEVFAMFGGAWLLLHNKS